MSTYLQNITDVIPQTQPFQPDLNFYGNVMQTKQTQYDNNWKALNKMYGQFYHAPLTREDNMIRKDNYLHQIESDLKKVSQLDLSLEQNVSQATQVFKPFYEDRSLTKDMAFTRNYMNNVSYGEGLKNAYDQKLRDQAWDTGLTELHFRRQEFKDASSEEAITMESVQYTPYVNAVEKAQEIAKSAGLSVESVNFSKDGKWIIKNKNGEQLIEPLQKLFEARLGNDPGIQAVYKTQAYVNRKTFAESNAAQFGGNKDLAEMRYLEANFNRLKSQSIARHEDLKLQSASYDAKIKNIEKQIKEGNASPEAAAFLAQYKMNKEINDEVLIRSENEQKNLSFGQSTPSTTTGFNNPYGDIKSLRFKVDNAMASVLMQKDLDEAAHIFAFKDAKTDVQANPYGVLAEKHRFSMQEISARNAGLERAAMIRNAGDRQNKIDAGEIIPNEVFNESFVEQNDKGTSTDKLNAKEASRFINRFQTESVAKPYLSNTLLLMNRLVEQGDMSQQEASKILAYGNKSKVSIDEFNTKLSKYGSNWLSSVGSNDLKNIQDKMNTWLTQNGALSGMNSEEYVNYQKASAKFGDYTNYLKSDANWRKKTSYQVEQDLRNQGFKNVAYLYDDNGNLRSRDDFGKKLMISGYDKNKSLFSTFSDMIGQGIGGGHESLNQGKNVNSKISNYAYDLYDELVAAAAKVYTSGKIKSPVGFPTAGLTKDGTGKYTIGSSMMWVNPKGYDTKNTIRMGEIFQDINNIDWGDTSKNRATFGGISKTTFDTVEGKRNAQTKVLLDALQSELSNPKSKMTNFRAGVSPIATGSLNKAAIVIHPDPEWLKKFVKTGKEGQETGVITADEYNRILKSGMSIITDASNLKNSLYQNSFMSPLAAYIEYNGEYTHTDDANPDYKITISKNKIDGGGDYLVTYQAPLWNPNTGAYEYKKRTENLTQFGTNVEAARDLLLQEIPATKELNILLHNGKY